MYPRIRSGHAVVHLERGQSVIGSMTFGLGQAIPDERGVLVQLNEIIDGTRSYDQVVEDIGKITDSSHAAARRFLDELTLRGHIEDASAATSLELREQDRYSRNAHYYAWIAKSGEVNRWRPQEALKNSHVAVLGIGGIGGAIATHLVAAGVGSVTIIDGDEVELSNLARQYLFASSDLGRPKVHVAAQRLGELNPLCTIHAHHQIISGPVEVQEFVDGKDLVFRAADQPAQMPYWVSDAALSLGTPWIDCSYAGPVINCCTYVPGVTGCYRCLRDSDRDKLAEEGRAATISETAPAFNAAFGPVVHTAASLAAYEGIRYLTDLTPRSVGRALHQNMFDYSHSYAIDVPENCPHGE